MKFNILAISIIFVSLSSCSSENDHNRKFIENELGIKLCDKTRIARFDTRKDLGSGYEFEGLLDTSECEADIQLEARRIGMNCKHDQECNGNVKPGRYAVMKKYGEMWYVYIAG